MIRFVSAVKEEAIKEDSSLSTSFPPQIFLLLVDRSWKFDEKMKIIIWLEQTKNFDHNVCFCCGDCYTHGNEDCKTIINFMIDQKSRWKEVDFRWDNFRVSGDSNITLTDMTNLTSLCLHNNITSATKDDSEEHPAPVSLTHVRVNLAKSSNVKTVDLRGYITLEIGGNTTPGLSSLPELERLTLAPSEESPAQSQICLDILKAAPKLEELRVALGPSSSDPINYGLAPVKHGLKTLHLSSSSAGQLASVIGRLKLSSLETLYYCSNLKSGQDNSGAALLDFVKGSNSRLTCLDISVQSINDQYLVEIFRNLPTLKKLRIAMSPLSAQFFKALTLPDGACTFHTSPNSDQEVIFPELTHFCLCQTYDGGNCEEWVKALSDMLTSRLTKFEAFSMAATGSEVAKIAVPFSPKDCTMIINKITHKSRPEWTFNAIGYEKEVLVARWLVQASTDDFMETNAEASNDHSYIEATLSHIDIALLLGTEL